MMPHVDPNFEAPASWYAIYCKSRHERQAHQKLAAKGVETFIADYETSAQWGARRRKVKKNLLPGYLLVRVNKSPHLYYEILQTPGVVKFVGNPWPHLSFIPDAQVESLQVLLASQQSFLEVPYWSSGDAVEVIAGPLLGFRGRVISVKDNRSRVIVSIDVLQRSVQVELDSSLLARAKKDVALA
jgi:transcription antitermination factor NusG